MTFSMTEFKAFSVIPDSKTKKYALQHVEMTIQKSAAGDVALDLYNPAGTFWSAVIASVTTGPLAQKASDAFALISLYAEKLVSCEITAANGFLYRVNAAPAAATTYQLLNGSAYPLVGVSIVLNNNAAPSELKIALVLALTDTSRAVDFEY